MAKETKSGRLTATSKGVSRPIGVAKAAKFAAVEGLRLSASSKALDKKLSASGLKGDAYRAEVIKAFKKG